MPSACFVLLLVLVFFVGAGFGGWMVRRYVLRLPILKRLAVAWLIVKG